MNFMEFHRYEMDALKPSKFEGWAANVEDILGHDLDGDQQEDGYSIDFAFDAFKAGMTPQQYAASVRRPA